MKEDLILSLDLGTIQSVKDLSRLFAGLNTLYNRLLVLKQAFINLQIEALVYRLNWSSGFVVEGDCLRIKAITTQSPIKVDLLGMGGIIDQVRGIIRDIRFRKHDLILRDLEVIDRVATVSARLDLSPDERQQINEMLYKPIRRIAPIVLKHGVTASEPKKNEEGE